MSYEIIVGNKHIKVSKETFEEILNAKPDTEFLNECRKIANMFNKEIKE